MKKVWISVCLVFAVMFVTSSIMGAQSPTPVELPPDIANNVEVQAVLENLETGEKITLVPHLVDFQRDSTSEESIAITYEVGIPGHMLGISPSPINEQSILFPRTVFANEEKYKCDSTSSVCARLTFYYHDGIQGDREWMYADKVRNVWDRLDSQVSWSNGVIGAECRAEWFDGSGTCMIGNEGYVSSPISGVAYEIVPTFAGSGKKTLVDDINFQKASQKITLHRSGSSWEFSHCIVNGGGNLVYGCY
jgi:hypothetical protein